MALLVIQSGANLQLVDENGVVSAPLTIPAGITLRTDVPPRWAVYNDYVILVDTPSEPLTIDHNGIVRVLSPKAPRLAPILSAVAGGTLSGTYGGVRYTFVTFDAVGNVISESDYSPPSNTVSLTNQFLRASGLDISPNAISARRLYRPTSGGAVLFQWVTLDGNVLTSVQDDLSDAGLSIVASPILGTPPHLTTIAEFRGRLFGGSDTDLDHLHYTEAGFQYAWPSDNILVIPPVGADDFGIVALIPRREALGVGRRNTLLQVTGTGAEDSNGIPDFDVVILSKELGVESQESVCVFRDTAYFLWEDGVYAWNSNGITCVSDGTAAGIGNVRSWFDTNNYFNRDQFPIAFAHIDQSYPLYRLFLCSAGSNVIDSWVEYNLEDGTWFGPHSTQLFTPTSAFHRTNTANRYIPVIGSVDTLYNDQPTRTDGLSTPITFDIIGKGHDLGEPDMDKYFGELSIIGKAQPSAGIIIPTMQVISNVGEISDTTELIQNWDMTKNRQRLGRPGAGKTMQLEFKNDQVGVDATIYGYEINPVNILGRR